MWMAMDPETREVPLIQVLIAPHMQRARERLPVQSVGHACQWMSR